MLHGDRSINTKESNVELHEYDEIIRTLMRIAAHQDIINEKQVRRINAWP